MPKIVDHEARKDDLVKSFLDLATKTGLENVSLRGVASHANVSLRQVQYYFGSKNALVTSGLDHLTNSSYQGVAQRLSATDGTKGAIETFTAIFEEAMPTDEKSKQFHQLSMSYAMLSLTRLEFNDQALLEGANRLQNRIEEVLIKGIRDGELNRDINIKSEAILLLGLINGLGTAVLLGQQMVESAMESFLYHVDKLKK
ncbi:MULTISPECIES: TetR family transcriptional regulator C-terminal domain-containing protein [unclassified Vibrio]|uniref:TetR/AcrR family transcriptional regulator n=1 Tax=unclassified Vibrio TaxID=2614977 RepID=UPI001F492A0A|nr:MULTISPECIES: TetR family transcriptional regulator C-terminal domain-containing protein [unclassified Vibrio]QXL80195.1 HTH-type transcriptional regulator BetI [Vibrio sp.]